MILKVDTKTGDIIMAGPETYIITPYSPTVQIVEDNRTKFEPNRIRTYIIDGETAFEYEDPHKPHYDIHRCKVKQHAAIKDVFFLHDENNGEIHHMWKDSRGIGFRVKREKKPS